jgi:hypothetical protein
MNIAWHIRHVGLRKQETVDTKISNKMEEKVFTQNAQQDCQM